MVYDAVVIGSGFGGAVTACRLAQAGRRVCILERGARYEPGQNPLRLYRYHYYRRLDVLVASGVGGGSLVYANVQAAPPAEVFASGWPAAVTPSLLAPYYQRVRETLHPSPYPRGDALAKTNALRRGAELTGRREQFRMMDLAVYWGQPGVPDPDPYGFGTAQTGCADLARCSTGCPILAKNTLDLNYLALAARHGAECRPRHEVTNIARRGGGGFAVHYVDRGRFPPKAGEVHASRVVLAAGTLGSTALLLRAAHKFRTLGPLSPALGQGFSANGNLLAAVFGLKPPVNPKVGPSITAGITYPEEEFIIEDGGVPPVLQLVLDPRLQPLKTLNALPLLLIGRDAADGRMRLARRHRMTVEWSPESSMPLFDAMARRAGELARALGGRVEFPPTWTLERRLLTVHPLGGCRMADTPEHGVVDARGAVFGQPGLYVADGSIVPVSLGINPSFTIAALAEHVAAEIIREG